VAAVAANALSFQTGRHPAPLFAKGQGSPPGPRPAAEARAEPRRAPGSAPPVPPARPAAPEPGGAIGDLIRGEDHTTASVTPREAPARAVPPARAGGLKEARRPEAQKAGAPGSEAPRAEAPREAKAEARRPDPAAPKDEVLHAAAASSARKPDSAVSFAQKALVKLGYGPLAIDGLAGPSTRAALERFERARRLPGTPEVASRTLRELASRSGLRP
ncbi:peptidoglycan-binding domain-containing protein, partial [Methylobacterium crusticola]